MVISLYEMELEEAENREWKREENIPKIDLEQIDYLLN